MQSPHFPENYLYRLWFSGFLNGKNIKTDSGDNVKIISHGLKNSSNGPDILNAKIEYNDQIKTGNIEFHVSIGDWYQHNHQLDPVYNSVIMHISFENPSEEKFVQTQNRNQIPNITLSSFVDFDEMMSILTLAEKINFQSKLPCSSHIQSVSENLKRAWLMEIGHQSFIQKVNRVAVRLNELLENPNYPVGKRYVWDQLLYEGFFRALGYPHNKENFETLAKATPVNDWNETENSCDELFEKWIALSGLEDHDSIKPILKKEQWKTGGIYKINHPENRLKAASELIQKFVKSGFLKPLTINLEAHLNMNSEDSKIISDMLNLLKTKNKTENGLGKQKRESIVFNTWFPVLYLYAKTFNRQDIQKRILDYCDQTNHHQQIAAEERILDSVGIANRTFTLQWGGLELEKNWCSEKRCLECRIGKEILRN